MYLTVNDTKLYYEKKGAGQPLLLVHGNGENHKIFDKIIKPLSKHYTVYAIDSRGHGKSIAPKGAPTRITYELMASDLTQFIKKLHLVTPYFYGFSDGGILGLLIASKQPHLLGKLIISGANTHPKGIRRGWRYLFSMLAYISRNPITKLMLYGPHIQANDLQRIQTPTLVLAGERDIIKPSDTRFIARNIPNSSLKILTGEGHASYVVHSKKLLPLILSFCEKK